MVSGVHFKANADALACRRQHQPSAGEVSSPSWDERREAPAKQERRRSPAAKPRIE
jgi:hypothetical protein